MPKVVRTSLLDALMNGEPLRVTTVLVELLRFTLMTPLFVIEKRVVVELAVELPIANKVVAVSPLLVWIENLANGDEVPMPIEPEVGSVNLVDVAESVAYTKLPKLSWLLAKGD